MAVMDIAQLQQIKARLKKGASDDQKTAINYFLPEKGCIGMLTKISDETYDSIIKKMVASCNSYRKAINKIGLDEDELKEIPPVTLYGYEDTKDALTRTTSDGKFRSDRYAITHLFFSATQVYMYKLVLSTTSDERKERTEEYFYKDITNFSTSDETVEAWSYKGCSPMPTKTNVNTQRFSLIVPGDKFSCFTTGDIEQQVRAMKNKLREKKI